MSEIWNHVLARLADELPDQQVNTWLRPLQAVAEPGALRLLAPNRFAVEWVQLHAAPRIQALLSELGHEALSLAVEMGSLSPAPVPLNGHSEAPRPNSRRAPHLRSIR
jgi:chromosomal replication initiator protein